MSHPKPLLIPWLRTQIDSAKYPGVLWTNTERTEFSIPWKHALRQDSSDIDILIFKAWAEVSSNSRAHGEPSVWKRNFRSALRAKGFKLLSDNKNDAANPHKVFRWPDESASGANPSAGSQVPDDPDLLEHLCLPTQESRPVPCFDLPEATVFAANSSAGSQVQDDPDLYEHLRLPTQESRAVPCFEDCLYLPEDTVFAETTADQDILQECLKGLNIGPEAEGTAVFEPPPEQQHLQNPVAIGGPALPGQQQYPVAFEGAVGEAGLPEQPACPMERAVGGAYDGQFVEQFLHTMNMASDGDNFKTQFRISVYYRGVMVSEQLVENEVGIRLVYRPGLIGQTTDHESGLSLFSLPSPGAMLDQTQANLTQRILDMLGDGVDVGVSGHVVYGQRRGEIKAFWSFSKFDRSRQPQEISKLQPQPLYLFKDFVRGILDFIDGRDCPPCSLFLCLGEKWPDPDNRPWEKKLITVEVVLTSMELLKNIAVVGGASSLQSVELQMSLEEMMEMY